MTSRARVRDFGFQSSWLGQGPTMRAILPVALLAALAVDSTRAKSQPAPSTFDQLVAQAMKCQGTDEGRAYHKVVATAYQTKLSTGLTYCTRLTRETSKNPFQAVLAIQADGKVSQAAVSPETDVSRCFRDRLLHAVFPPPPFAPFFDARKVNFHDEDP